MTQGSAAGAAQAAVASTGATQAGEGCGMRWEWEARSAGLWLRETDEQGERRSSGGMEGGLKGNVNKNERGGGGLFNGVVWQLKGLLGS